MFRKILIATTLCILFSLLTSVSFAQDNGSDVSNQTITNSQIPQDEVIRLEFIQQVQNPETGQFDYVVKIKSLIDTNRLRLTWEIVNKNISVAPTFKLTDAVNIRKDQEIYITKTFIPLRAGFEEIRITAISFGDREDYYSFHNTEFFINEELKVAPNKDEYKTAVTIKDGLSAAKRVIIIVNIFLFILIVFWRFKVWIESD